MALSPEFGKLSPAQKELVLRDIARNGNPDPTLDVSTDSGRVEGPVFSSDRAQGALSQAAIPAASFAVPNPAIADAPQEGALTRSQRTPGTDMRALMEQFIPQDDSRSKYLALAAGLVAPNKSGSFGESVGNVANALQQERASQEKLRSQYVPIIMQQVAAQQAREERAQYQMEAQQAQREGMHQKAEADRVARAAAQLQSDTLKRELAQREEALKRDIAASRSSDAKDKLAMMGVLKGIGTNVPKLKPGEKWNEDTQTIEPIVGSDLYRKQADMYAKDFGALGTVEMKAKDITGLVGELLDPKNKGALNSNFGGYNALATRYLPGETQNVKAKIDRLKAVLEGQGLELTRLGGSIGAITQAEWPKLGKMIANIDPRLSEDEADKALRAVSEKADEILKSAQGKYAAEWGGSVFDKNKKGTPPLAGTPPPASGASDVTSLIDKYRSKK